MRAVVALVVLLALVATSSSVASHGEPRKRLTPADERRADAILLRVSDLEAGFTAVLLPASGADFYCKALDESDLVVTGEARSPHFRRNLTFVSSTARIYRSNVESQAAWDRAASRVGERCVRELLTSEFEKQGVPVLSFDRVALSRTAVPALAHRLVVSSSGARIYIDLIALRYQRAQIGVLASSPLEALPRTELHRLARILGSRVMRVMRSSS